ncbi:MAG: hypothetical protein V1914_03105 [archaeon]
MKLTDLVLETALALGIGGTAYAGPLTCEFNENRATCRRILETSPSCEFVDGAIDCSKVQTGGKVMYLKYNNDCVFHVEDKNGEQVKFIDNGCDATVDIYAKQFNGKFKTAERKGKNRQLFKDRLDPFLRSLYSTVLKELNIKVYNNK